MTEWVAGAALAGLPREAVLRERRYHPLRPRASLAATSVLRAHGAVDLDAGDRAGGGECARLSRRRFDHQDRLAAHATHIARAGFARGALGARERLRICRRRADD